MCVAVVAGEQPPRDRSGLRTTEPMSDSPPRERLGGSAVLTILALSLGIFTVANDFTALSVAVPRIESDLGTTLNRAQWVVNGYTVVFGVLIVTAGRLADLLGRRRIFLVGAAVFGSFSLLGGLAPNIESLIAARAFMGIGGAMMWPSVIGMIYAIVPASRSGLAGGIVIGVAGLGNSVGPLVGGAFTELLSWRWIFLVNVPIALVAGLVVRRTVPESKVATRARVDALGVATLSAAVILILVALDIGSGEATGFASPPVVAMLVLGVALLPVFAVQQRHRGEDALVPRRVMSRRTFTGAVLSILCMGTVLFGVLLYVPQYLEKDLGWGPFAAGAALLPLQAVFAAVSFAAGPLYQRVGGRTVLTAGAGCLTGGALLLAALTGHGYPPLVPGLVLLGTGVGLYFSAVTTAAITSVDADDASLAGGIVYMGNVAGGSVGLGVNTAIVLAAGGLVAGIRHAFLVDAALAAIGTAIVVTVIRPAPVAPSVRSQRQSDT